MLRFRSKASADSLILVTDPAGTGVPVWDISGPIATGPDCLLIRCRGGDAETEVQLGSSRDVDPGYGPIALRTLQTPSRVLVIGSPTGEILGRLRTLEQKTSILIWVNDRAAPDRISIGLFKADGVVVPADLQLDTSSATAFISANQVPSLAGDGHQTIPAEALA